MGTLTEYVNSKRRYRVVTTMLVVRKLGGTEEYVKNGKLVPANADPSHLETLADLGLIEEVS